MDIPLRGPGYESETTATAHWVDGQTLRDVSESPGPDPDRNPFYYRRGSLLLGETADAQPNLVGWNDNRHAITVAGSRAGKGRSGIIPNLWFYPGSVFCIDPKGENARLSVAHRADQNGLGQQIYVLDPFRISDVPPQYLASFNPLDRVVIGSNEELEQIGAIADSMIIASDPKNAHWDESARSLIEALIAHVMSGNMRGRPVALSTVRELLRRGDELAANERSADIQRDRVEFPGERPTPTAIDPFVALLDEMKENEAFDGIVAGQAHKLAWLGADERGSILSFAERNTRFLEGDPMKAVLDRSLRTLDLDKLKNSSQGISVFLCLPARYMSSHSRWLRLIISSLMLAVETDKEPPRTGVPILAILDEFPILGHHKLIESAIGYMAGFGLKIWVILQDLSQLKRDYPDSWETFLGNAGMKQFFGNTDITTLEYISSALGQTEIRRTIVDIGSSTANTSSVMSDRERRDVAKARGGLRKRDLANQSEMDTVSENARTEVVATPLMMPDEIALHFGRDTLRQVVLASGEPPMILRRINQDQLTDRERDLLRQRNRS